MGFFSGITNAISDVVESVGDIGQTGIDLTKEALKPALAVGKWSWENPVEAALLGAGGYYFAPEIGAWFNPATGEAVAGTAAGTEAGAATANLASSGTGLQSTGGLGLTGGTTANLGAMGGAQGLTGLGTTGTTLGATGGALSYGGLGAGLGLSAAATGLGTGLGTGMATGTGLGALSASQLGQLGLIQGGLGLAGGLLGGNAAADATEQAAQNYANLAREASALGKFTPVGTTTRFGTSNFTVDPVTGGLKADYTLSPEAQAYQTSLSGLGTQGLNAAQGLMNLGQQYIGESPEAVRQRYIETQRAALAPGQEQQLAGIRNRLFQTGRGGLATGATQAGGLAATNPEMAAYYNSLANTERQLAANAETQYQNQVNFGTNLLGGATTPFANVFSAQKGVESAAQQPLELSTNLANLASTAGARQGTTYANLMAPSIQASQQAASYSPFSTAAMGAASNPLLGLGLMNWYNS